MKPFNSLLLKLRFTTHFFLLMCYCCFCISNLKAQCPVGETEVTISFANNYYASDNLEWNYTVGNILAETGPYSVMDTIIICVPEGDLAIVGCGNWMTWISTEFEIIISEDGSVNGCGNQNGCLVFNNFENYSSGNYGINACTDSIYQSILTIPIGNCNDTPVVAEGCTNPNAPNFDPCATIDNNTCEIITSNDNCEDATLLEIKPIGTCNSYDIVYNNPPNTFSGIPNCLDYTYYTLEETPYDLFHKVVVPPSGNFAIRKNKSIHLGIYDACNGNNLQCIYSNSPSEDIEIFDYPPGDTILLQFLQYNGIFINMCLEELPPSLENDLCENATPLCGNLIESSNEFAFTSENDPLVSCHNKSFDVKNTLWYSFTADDSGQPMTVYVNEESCNVSYYGEAVTGFGGLSLGILSGSCGAPIEEYCTYFFENGTNTYMLDLENPIAGTTYYVYISSHANADFCSYDIATSSGVETCCGLDVSLNAVCENIEDDNFFVDITLPDLGDNPSGYIINDGNYPDITIAGTSTIGPFPLGITTIKLTGKDDASCELVFKIDSDCTPLIDNNICSTPKPIATEDKDACNELTSVKVSDIGNNSGLVPSCHEENAYYFGSISGDRFYSFTVPPSGKFKVKISSGKQTHAALYTACEGEELECVLGIRDYDFLNYQPGETLILQVWQTGSSGVGPYTVCVEEVDPPPTNDNCSNAIPLCGSKVLGSTEGTSTSDVAIPNCSGVPTEENLWYSFVANTDTTIYVYFTNTCTGGPGLPYESGLIASLLEGDCEAGFSTIDCIYTAYDINSYYEETNVLELQNPVPGNTYYLSMGVTDETVCTFEITTSTGIELCCGDNIFLEQNCEGTDGENYFVDVTSTNGTLTYGPFANGLSNIKFTTLEDPDCDLELTFNGECIIGADNITCVNAEPYNVLSVGSCINYPGYNYFPSVNTKGAPLDLTPSCLSGNSNNYTNLFYEVIVPTSGNFQFISSGGLGLTIYESCNSAEVFCKPNSSNEIFKDYAPADTLIFQVWQFNNEIGFCLQELPNAPENDLCENAIPLCKGSFSGSNIHATEEVKDFFPSCNEPKNTVWYSFVPQNDGPFNLEISTTFECINYFIGYGELLVSVFSGECGGPFVEEICEDIDPYDTEGFLINNLVADQPYYIQISSIDDLECNFDITIKEGVKPCCAPDIFISPICPDEEETDVFYVDIAVTDLGENPSGYVVNGGDFPNITTTGITTIGPFENGSISITLEGLDVDNCVISESINKVCNCSTLNTTNANRDRLIFIGDTLELDKPNFSLLGYECEFMWVTNPDNPTETYIGDDETLILIPDASITIYAISTCANCKQYIVAYDITVIDYGVCSDLTTVASSGTVLFYGNYYNYSFATELTIELQDTTECEFLYWVSDISDPEGSIISTEQSHTVNVSGGAAINFFGIASCGDEECVELVTVYTPVFDDNIDDPDDYGNPGQPGTPGEPDPGEDGNLDPCPGISAGMLNTVDKYICFGEQPAVTLTDTEIPADYSLYYAYHNSTELSTSSFVYALSFNDLSIPENVLPCATAIYLTAFVAPTVSNLSEINLSDDCVEMSNTLEITYLCPVQIQVQEICNSNGTYNLAVTVAGGLPQVLGNLPFSIYGTVFKGNANHGQTFTITNLPDGSNYQIEAVDSEMCHDWVTGNVQCDKLPVELLTFDGEAQANGNLLKWSTATEIDNDYFTIESSSNGNDFTALGTVKGSGHTSLVSNYQFLDRQASNGITYYRLSQTDFNGNSTIEAVTEVSRGETSDITLLQTYPVPFLAELNLQVYSNSQSEIDINLLDVTGREVLQKRFVLDKGLNEISLSTKSLPKGLYLIAMKSEAGMSYHKVIKD